MNAPPDILLETRRLGWRTRGVDILHDVSLQLHAGEMLGLIGPNGSGKTTFLRLLAGVLEPTAGDVLLEGQPMRRLPRRRIARTLALVSQMADTADAITVQDAVELGRTPWLSALQTWSPHDSQIVDRALQLVDMHRHRRRVWSTLSGGERQRTHIARSLAQEPRILLLDEPTNHLDIQHQLALLQLIRSLPLTLAIVLHDLNHALLCDRLAVLHQGRLIETGPPARILRPDLLRNVFRVDVHTLADPQDGASVLRFLPLSEPPSKEPAP